MLSQLHSSYSPNKGKGFLSFKQKSNCGVEHELVVLEAGSHHQGEIKNGDCRSIQSVQLSSMPLVQDSNIREIS